MLFSPPAISDSRCFISNCALDLPAVLSYNVDIFRRLQKKPKYSGIYIIEVLNECRDRWLRAPRKHPIVVAGFEGFGVELVVGDISGWI